MNMPALKYSQIHQGFHTFINEDVLPTCGIEASVFWQAIEKLICDYANQPNTFINEAENYVLAANTRIAPVIDRQQLIQAANSRWLSLFQFEGASTKSKAYLDEHFALASGSHSEVKNYVVYYHHLLAFFEDGSQAGLVNPSQFVALCGHKCSPDSIVLQQSPEGLHVEVIVDRNGERGANDIAGIQDILVETNDPIVVDFNAVQIDGESKIQAYKNLQSFLRGDLQTFTIVRGQQTSCRMHNEATFTDLNGDDYCIDNQLPVQIRCANQCLVTELMRDDRSALAPQVIVDAVVTSLITRNSIMTEKQNTQTSLLLENGSFTPEMMKRIEDILTP